MTNSNHQPSSLIAATLQLAKKVGSTSLEMIQHVAPDTTVKLTEVPDEARVIEGQATQRGERKKNHYAAPQQLMREHFPRISSQLLGRHYQKINHVTSFISPGFNDKVADYFFERLNNTVSKLSSSEALLNEVGAKDLIELSKDPARSARISVALCNQNKILAAMQGAASGVTGVLGAAVDIPFSIALALRGIYQTGHAYGFELNAEDHPIVEYVFKQIDLGSVAEKQTVLATIRNMAQVLKEHNLQQLQRLVGSSNDVEYLKKYLVDAQGEFKWAWMQHVPQTSFVAKLAPIANLGVGARYSMQLVEDAGSHAQHIFHHARLYLLEHPETDLDLLSAYQQAMYDLKQVQLSLNLPADEVEAPN